MNEYSLSDLCVPMREGFDVTRDTDSDIPINLGQPSTLSLLKDKCILSPSKIGYITDKSKTCDNTIEGLQSKIRELEKKAQLQNVLHEELALEMAAIKCTARSSNSTGIQANIAAPLKCETTTWSSDIETFSPDSVLSVPGCSSIVHTSVQDTVTRQHLSKCTTNTEHNSYTSPLSRISITPALPQTPLTMNLVPSSTLKTAAEAQYHPLTLGSTLDRACLKPQMDLTHHPQLSSQTQHVHHQPRVMPQVPTGLPTVFDLDKTFGMLKAGRFGGLHTEHTITSTHDSEVDMLDIPGKGRCYVYIAKYYYDPFAHSPNDYPEAELCINAGDYLLVWGSMDEDGFFDGELLDGRRGLVPSNFVLKLVGDDLLEFHQSVVQGLRDCDDTGSTNIPQDFTYQHLQTGDFSQCVPGDHEFCDFLDDEDEDDDLHPTEASVAAPKQLTLERQLNKSVLIGWNHPDTSQTPPIDCYHVYVDGVLKVTVKATERPRALVEGVDSNRAHRISVRSVTVNRRTSRDAACTMVIGKDVPLGPTSVRACRVTATSAIISWMPSNSNYQHTVCVNNVELRTVKPGIYRHTITGLAPNTVYRVTVKAKNIRAPHFDEKIIRPERYSCHIDFCTLPKGLPEPPSDIQLEAGPQDGTVLVTWHPVSINSDAVVTGYSVYADGKKVTDVDSPTGDHALIDINKLLSLNPKQITVRTKAHDSQSTDSIPTQIPSTILKARNQAMDKLDEKGIRHGYGKSQQRVSQVVIETEENLSDKEIYPNNHISIPAIEITKDSEMNLSEDDSIERHMLSRGTLDKPRSKMHHRPSSGHHQSSYRKDDRYRQSDTMYMESRDRGRTRESDWNGLMGRGVVGKGSQSGPSHHTPSRDKQIRWFVALFDYDPTTMSPNPDACEEELPFLEGDSIKVYGDKDPDGFYWGECKGRRGFVPHNMVVEVQAPDGVGSYRSGDRRDRDRWGDIYANMTVKKMIALYDYDPEELSPNADAEVELSFRTGNIIYVYGEMDDDGFYIGELNGVRGLVPSNFLTGAPTKMDNEMPQGNFSKGSKVGPRAASGKGHGPGARGPPLPPRQPEPPEPHKDACPVFKPVEQRQDGKVEKEPARTNTAQGSVTRKYQAPINPLTTFQAEEKQPNLINNINTNTTTTPGHNFMQKLTEITSGTDTSVDNILSKGKELIFMKFGLGK